MSPGVYIMKNSSGRIIYVGKSKVLKNRVSSYFKGSHNIKTEKMVSQVASFEFICCESEIEALALENKLIKLHAPKYNIRLKDSKSYPYITIDLKKDYPVIGVQRERKNDGKTYFGPYSSMSTAYSIKDSVDRALCLIKCRRVFPRDIGKERPCIYYKMGKCTGVCTGNVSPGEYREAIISAVEILKGGISPSVRAMATEMEKCAEEERFEEAALIRDRIAALGKLKDRQSVVTDPGTECDVFGYCVRETKEGETPFLSSFFIRDGYIADRDYFRLDDEAMLNESDAEEDSPFTVILTDIYSHRTYIPKTICLSFDIPESDRILLTEHLSEKAGRKVSITTPVRGKMKALTDMAAADAGKHADSLEKKKTKEEGVLLSLAKELRLEVYPERIESIDISNIGSEIIKAGIVVYKDGKKFKEDYRLYGIEGQSLKDDYAAMTEALERRMKYSFVPKEDKTYLPLPDLLFVDGGIGHVNAVSALMKRLGITLPVFGMVKDDRHRTRALLSEDGEAHLKIGSELYNFIYNIQEETHRFIYTKTVKAKRKKFTRSALENIDGIGPAKAKKLLSRFGSLKKLKEASPEEIAEIKGLSLKDGENISKYFREKENTK